MGERKSFGDCRHQILNVVRAKHMLPMVVYMVLRKITYIIYALKLIRAKSKIISSDSILFYYYKDLKTSLVFLAISILVYFERIILSASNDRFWPPSLLKKENSL